jgi:hypothetical protein
MIAVNSTDTASTIPIKVNCSSARVRGHRLSFRIGRVYEIVQEPFEGRNIHIDYRHP